MDPGRRHLLRTGAALATSLLASGASRSSEPSLGRVVVVGGGFGGATAARYLRLWGGNIHVTLVERNPSFTSCPMSNLVLGGYKQMGDITRTYDSLSALGVHLVQGEVLSIDVPGRSVRLADYLRDNPVDPNAIVYLCGNRGMIVDAFEILRDQGVPGNNLFTEVFF